MEQFIEGKEIGKFQLIKLIGKGGFGEVWEVKDEHNQKYALKLFNLINSASDINTSSFEDEFYMIKQLVHPNLLIPTLLEKHNDVYYIVMPLCDKSLMDDLRGRLLLNPYAIQNRLQIYTERELSIILRDVADGLAYLKEHGIVHKDIKPDNILLQNHGSKCVYKISDFGISDKFAVSTLKVTKLLDTKTDGIAKAYAPPEYFEKKIDAKSDVFSLAMSIFELATGDTLQGENGFAFGELLNNLSFIPLLPEQLNYSRRFCILLQACLNPNPKKRPSAKDIAIWSDEFISKGSWPNEMTEHLNALVNVESHSLKSNWFKLDFLNVKWLYMIGIFLSAIFVADYSISKKNENIAEGYFSQGDNTNAKKYFTKAVPYLLSSASVKSKLNKTTALMKNYSQNSRFYGENSIAMKNDKYTIIGESGETKLNRMFDFIIPLNDNSFLLKFNSQPCDSIYLFKNDQIAPFSLKNKSTNETMNVQSLGCNLIFQNGDEIGLRNCTNQIFTLIK